MDQFGAAQVGKFLNGLSTYSLSLNAQGEALVEFRVGMQPGNNYRIAVSPFVPNNINSLQVNSPSGVFFVPTGNDQVQGFNGAISPMLTVWRKLHVEFDSMSAPNGNAWSGTLRQPFRNTTKPGQLMVYYNLNASFPNKQFQNGILDLGVKGQYKIIDSGNRRTLDKFFLVEGVPTGLFIPPDWPFVAYDDDDRYLKNHALYPSALGLNSPALPINNVNDDGTSAQSGGKAFGQALIDGVAKAEGLNTYYSSAFIKVVDANSMGISTHNQILTFKANTSTDDSDYYNQQTLQLKGKDSGKFWAYSVTFGYQPEEAEDGDGDLDTGWTTGCNHENLLATPAGHAEVYLETCRDFIFDEVFDSSFVSGADSLRRHYYNRIGVTLAHELAHSPGAQYATFDHNEGGSPEPGSGVMRGGAPMSDLRFHPTTIRRLRRALSWTQGPP